MERSTLYLELQDIQSISVKATAGLLLIHPAATEASFQTRLLQLIAEAQDGDPILKELYSIPIPAAIAERIEEWLRFLVGEVIHHWRMSPSSDIENYSLFQDFVSSAPGQPSPLVDTLKSAGLQKPLQRYLQNFFQDLQTQQQQQKLGGADFVNWLEHKASQLEHQFVGHQNTSSDQANTTDEGFLTQLFAQRLSLVTKQLQSLTTILVQIQRLGSQSALRQLKVLAQILQTAQEQYVQQQQDQVRRAQSAQKAYKNLLSKIGEQRWGLRESARLWESALRALNLSYAARLEAEVFRLAVQILGDLLQPIQFLTLSIAQTDLFLIGVQQFAGESPPALPNLLKGVLLDRISPETLLRQLEIAVGYPLQQWTQIKTLTTATVQQELLQLLRPICFNVYVDCYLATIATPETPLASSIKPSLP
jgi:hypothetical protein